MIMTPESPRGSNGDGRSVIGTLNTLLAHRRVLLLVPLLFMGVAVAAAVLRDRAYRAESAFVPHTDHRDMSHFAGLAAQFSGTLTLPSNSGESADFYVWLLRSRQLLRDLAYTTFEIEDEGVDRSGNLFALLNVRGETQEESERLMFDRLRNLITVRLDAKTSIVTLRASAPSRELAVAMNRRLLDLVSAFNLAKRQSQSRAERQFVQARLADAQSELRAAEDRARRFLEENRQFDRSPNLTFEYSRLERQTDLQQQVYTSLAQAYEQARIDEVRNLPVITTVEAPEISVLPMSRRLILNALLAAVSGMFTAIIIIFVLEYVARQKDERPSEFAELERLMASLVPAYVRRGPVSKIAARDVALHDDSAR
jgi:uncharacterized protein involved in exopolysaccharide biosynthesis